MNNMSDLALGTDLGVQQFLGQFVSNWNAVLSSLTLAMIPILLFYIISKQMIRSITAGAG